MDIVEKIETSKANIRQISILASIPEGRVYKWVQRKSSPTGSDLKTVEHVVGLISNLSKEEIKKTVYQVANENNDLAQALKIATGNSSIKVEDLPVGDNIAEKAKEKNQPKVKGGTHFATDDVHKNDQGMERKILEILDRVTRTADKWADKALIDAQNQAEMISMLNRSKEPVNQ